MAQFNYVPPPEEQVRSLFVFCNNIVRSFQVGWKTWKVAATDMMRCTDRGRENNAPFPQSRLPRICSIYLFIVVPSIWTVTNTHFH